MFTILKKIYSKDHLGFNNKNALFFAYLKVRTRRFLDGRVNFFQESNVTFLGYTVKVDNFSDFYWTFLEIFIDEDYYFETDKKNPTIVDCGANIGIAILYFKWLYPKSNILSFEMEPSNLNLLKVNVSKNNIKDVQIIEKAVGAKDCVVNFYGNRRAGSISSELIAEQVKKDDSYARFGIEVEMVRLSKYLDKEVDFLKLDIEGAESDVFLDLVEAGKIELVNKTTIEFHKFSSKTNRLSEILKNFEDYDFDYIFPGNYSSLSELKRSYYNFMVRASKREK